MILYWVNMTEKWLSLGIELRKINIGLLSEVEGGLGRLRKVNFIFRSVSARSIFLKVHPFSTKTAQYHIFLG